MADKNTQIVLGPNIAARLEKMLWQWEHYPRYSTAPNVPATPNFLPIPKIGKAAENIGPRAFGKVDIWQGKPQQETQITQLESVQEFNLLDRMITKGKFCWMFGQYIFGATFPARQIEATLTAQLTGSSGTASASVTFFTDGDDPGSAVQIASPGTIGTRTIAANAKVFALWDDKNQQYVARGWDC